MNFLDAHKIVHDYGKPFSEGKSRPETALCIPISSLPEYLHRNDWKDVVIQAHQIFFSHMILWNTRTSEQLDQYLMLIGGIDRFRSDDEINEIKNELKVLKKEKTIYGILNKKKIKQAKDAIAAVISSLNLSSSYGYNDIIDVINEMSEYKRNVFMPKMEESRQNNWSIPFGVLLSDYCERAYLCANIPFRTEYIDFFWNFRGLRGFLKDPQYRPIYSGYENYIETHQ